MRSTASSPSMIGREGDLIALRGEFAEVLSGRPRAVVIGGEAGIGKTRLLSEFVAAVSGDATVLVGQCVDLGADSTPYAPFTAVLRGLMTSLGDGQDGRDRLLEAAGSGRAVLPILLPELDAGSDEPRRTGAERLYELVAVLLETFSHERPIVIVLEDIHWADAATLELVRFLVRMLAESRVLIVMTYRSDEVPRGHMLRSQLPEWERTRRLTRWDLTRLTHHEVTAQVRAITGRDTDPAMVDGIFSRSEGVPFFVEELVCAEGDVVDVLPDTLRQLLLARYERLSESTQLVLRLISAGGVRVDHPLLSTVFDGDGDALDSAVREAMLANLLTVTDTEYAFRHALVREAIHDDLLPGERTRFHSRYAAALEGTTETCSSVRSSISYHWMMAHDLVRAFPATLDAMGEARSAYASMTAARMGERALEIWGQLPDAATVAGRSHIDLLQETAAALQDAGEGERALALTNLALDECDRSDADRYARLMRDKALYLANLSRPGSTAILEEALTLLSDEAGGSARVFLLTDLSGRLMLEARFDEAIDVASDALAEATRVRSVSRMSVSHNLRGVSLIGRGDIEGGLRDLREAEELAAHRDGAMLRYRVNASDVMYLIGRFEDAIRLGEQGTKRAKELGVERTSGAILSSNFVEALLAVGDWTRAEEILEQALALDAPPGFRVHLQRMKLWLALWKGDAAGAAELLRSWRSGMVVQSVIEMQSRLGFARIAAEIALALDDLEGAWRSASVVISPEHRVMSAYDLPLLTVAARVLARVRIAGEKFIDTSAAETAVRAVLEQSEAWPTAGVWMPVFEAELGGTEGRGTSVSAWRSAVEAAGGPGAPAHLRPYALYRLAQVQLQAGDRRAAETAAREAREGAADLGAGLLVGWVDALADRSGLTFGGADDARGGPSQPPEHIAVRLTDRESQVLELIGHGLSNRQIGERLFISTKTASVHVSAILRKLGATSRTEAVYRAQQAGVPLVATD